MSTIDEDVVNQMLEDLGEDAFNEVMGMFLENLDERVNNIKNAIETGEADELRQFAHAMKGTAATMGAMGLSALGKKLEDMCSSGDISAARETLDELNSLAAGTKAELSAKLP